MRMTNDQRTALRNACRDHANCAATAAALRSQGVIRSHITRVNSLEKAELIALAAALGINPRAVIAGAMQRPAVQSQPVPSQPVEGEDEGEDEGEGEGEDEGEDNPAALDVAGDVDAALAPLAPFLPLVSRDIVEALRDNVSALAVRAATPVTVTVEVPAAPAGNVTPFPGHGPAQPAPAPRRAPALPSKITGTVTAGRAFGLRHSWAASMNLDQWNAPDSPAPDRDFVFDPDVLRDVLSCMVDGSNLWLAGPAGTGKTSLAQEVAARLGRPFVRIPFDLYTEPMELIGSKGFHNGATTFDEGALTMAIQRPGCVILLDEPTAATKCHFALQTLLDFRFVTLKEDGGRVVRVAPGVTFIAADNTAGTGDSSGQYTGTGIANLAFRDRFAAVIPVTYLDPAKEADALIARTGCNPDVARMLVSFANLTRTGATIGKLSVGLGLRRLIAMARGLSAGIPAERCFSTRIVSQAAPDDFASLAEMQKAHLPFDGLDRAVAGAPAPGHASQATILDPAAQARARGRFDDPANP